MPEICLTLPLQGTSFHPDTPYPPNSSVFNNSRVGKAMALQFLTLIFSLKIKTNRKSNCALFQQDLTVKSSLSPFFPSSLFLPSFQYHNSEIWTTLNNRQKLILKQQSASHCTVGWGKKTKRKNNQLHCN